MLVWVSAIAVIKSLHWLHNAKLAYLARDTSFMAAKLKLHYDMARKFCYAAALKRPLVPTVSSLVCTTPQPCVVINSISHPTTIARSLLFPYKMDFCCRNPARGHTSKEPEGTSGDTKGFQVSLFSPSSCLHLYTKLARPSVSTFTARIRRHDFGSLSIHYHSLRLYK